MKFTSCRKNSYVIILIFLGCALASLDGQNTHNTPIFGKSSGGKMYFAIAASATEQSYSRAFNKTLMNITQSYLTSNSKADGYNVSLDTLIIELPENGSFTALLLEKLCEKFEGKHVVAVLVIGDSPAAFTVSLAATHSGIPVLWARGKGGYLPGFRNLVS